MDSLKNGPNCVSNLDNGPSLPEKKSCKIGIELRFVTLQLRIFPESQTTKVSQDQAVKIRKICHKKAKQRARINTK